MKTKEEIIILQLSEIIANQHEKINDLNSSYETYKRWYRESEGIIHKLRMEIEELKNKKNENK